MPKAHRRSLFTGPQPSPASCPRDSAAPPPLTAQEADPRLPGPFRSASFRRRRSFCWMRRVSSFGCSGAAMAAGRADASQAYTTFGSASRGIAGYNEQMSRVGTDSSIRDNNTVSTRQAREANTDSQVGRKQEWSRGLGDIPLLGGPIDLIREGVAGTVSTASGGKYGALPLTLSTRLRRRADRFHNWHERQRHAKLYRGAKS